MSNEPKIKAHTYQDPFINKKVEVITQEGKEIINVEKITLSSQEEFSTLLEKVKQYNNDPANQKEKRIQTIVSKITK